MDIVVGFVGTDEGRAALDRAIAEAHLRNARLLVVHSARGGPGQDVDEVLAYRSELEAIGKRLEKDGIDHELKELVRGNSAAEDLVEVAKETEADMIVIGIRRRSPVGKMILGSNAQEILLDAECPVLAVKATNE